MYAEERDVKRMEHRFLTVFVNVTLHIAAPVHPVASCLVTLTVKGVVSSMYLFISASVAATGTLVWYTAVFLVGLEFRSVAASLWSPS